MDRSHKVLEVADKIKGQVDHVAQFLDSTGKAVSEKMVYVKGSWQVWVSKAKAMVEAKVQDHKAEIEETASVAKIAAEVVK